MGQVHTSLISPHEDPREATDPSSPTRQGYLKSLSQAKLWVASTHRLGKPRNFPAKMHVTTCHGVPEHRESLQPESAACVLEVWTERQYRGVSLTLSFALVGGRATHLMDPCLPLGCHKQE